LGIIFLCLFIFKLFFVFFFGLTLLIKENMFIKRLAPNIYDVFVGNGWDNWTRVRRAHWGVAFLAGKKLNRTQLNHVRERVCQ
jgi:hypothetical protein